MAHDVLSSCPVCSGELTVTRLHCRSCCTALEGEFTVGRPKRSGGDRLGGSKGSLGARADLLELTGGPRGTGNPWRTM